MSKPLRQPNDFMPVAAKALQIAVLVNPPLRPAQWRRLATMIAPSSGLDGPAPFCTADGRWVSFVSIGGHRQWVYDLVEAPTRALVDAEIFESATEPSDRCLEVQWRKP